MLVVLAKNKYVGITSAIVAVAALSNNVETIHLAGGYRAEGLYVNYDCRISLTTFAGRDAYINGVNRASETQWFVYGILQHSVSHDYIVAQGTSGIWFYRKWNSGLAEFWGGKEIKGIGSVTAPAVDFPFPLISLLYKGASAIYKSGQKGVYVLSGTGASIGLVNTGVYVLNQDIKDNNTTTVAFIEYNVKGMWK